jgi:hypothetical protein
VTVNLPPLRFSFEPGQLLIVNVEVPLITDRTLVQGRYVKLLPDQPVMVTRFTKGFAIGAGPSTKCYRIDVMCYNKESKETEVGFLAVPMKGMSQVQLDRLFRLRPEDPNPLLGDLGERF